MLPCRAPIEVPVWTTRRPTVHWPAATTAVYRRAPPCARARAVRSAKAASKLGSASRNCATDMQSGPMSGMDVRSGESSGVGLPGGSGTRLAVGLHSRVQVGGAGTGAVTGRQQGQCRWCRGRGHRGDGRGQARDLRDSIQSQWGL